MRFSTRRQALPGQYTIAEVQLQSVQVDPNARDGFHPVRLATNVGEIEARLFSVANASAGAIFVGGAGGGFDSPSHGLYDRLCRTLHNAGIAGLCVRYRHANHLEECILDVLAGLLFLREQGIERAAVIGHSFGGAVVVCAGAISASPIRLSDTVIHAGGAQGMVKTVVALSTQTYGIQPVVALAPDCSILLLHGEADRVLSPQCSVYTYDLAHEPKELELYPNTGHGLDEAAEPIERRVAEWITRELGRE